MNKEHITHTEVLELVLHPEPERAYPADPPK
jgi:hypothetical protein